MRSSGRNINNAWKRRVRRPIGPRLGRAVSLKTARRLVKERDEMRSQFEASETKCAQYEVQNDELRKEIDEATTQLNRLQSELLRAHSDAQRDKRLTAGRAAQAAEDARIGIAERFMTVADEFATAIEMAEQQQIDPQWLKGFKSMADKIDKGIADAGYRRFESLGEVMDPTRHEALATMPASEENVDKVVQVVEAGYEHIETSKVVRVAKVLVGRAT